MTSHNFSVVMTDVCGSNKTANFTYSADGAKAISEVDYVDPSRMDEGTTFGIIPGTGRSRSTTSGAAAATTTAAAFVASVVLLGLLL